MILGAIVLFGITLAGIFISCKVFASEISNIRKITATGIFTILNIIPISIPLFSLLIPAIALYMSLIDGTQQHSQVRKVFGLTFVFAIIAILVVYLPQQ